MDLAATDRRAPRLSQLDLSLPRAKPLCFHGPVSRMVSLLKYWLPVVVWMVLIFGFSSDAMSFQHSSRIIGPLVHWLLPNLSTEKTNSIVFLVRKCAHLTEYALLAVLV